MGAWVDTIFTGERLTTKTAEPMISTEKHDAVKQFMLTVTVPILCDTPKGVDHIGTGTLFEIGDRSFLVTARHNFDNQEAKHFAVPNNPIDSDLQTLGRFVLHKPDNEAIDVAVLELLESTTIDAVKKGWRLLKPENAAIASPEGVFLLCGYPSERIRVHDGRLVGTLLLAYTARLKEVPKAEKPVDGRLDLFFHHGTEPTDLTGKPISGPHLRGTSGSSVWEYYESAANRSGRLNPHCESSAFNRHSEGVSTSVPKAGNL
jgi:hypothetical protein